MKILSGTVISPHALSVPDKQLLGNASGFDFISLLELKQIGSVFGIVRRLFGRKKMKIILYLCFENSSLLKGFMYLIPLICFCPQFYVFDENKVFVRKSILSSLAQIPLMAWTIFLNFLMLNILFAIGLISRGLKRKIRREIRITRETKLLYIKSNFWFGLQAGGSVGHISGVCNAFADLCQVNYLSPDKPIGLASSISVTIVKSFFRFSLPNELNSFAFNFIFLKCWSAFKNSDVFYQRVSLYNFTGVLFANIFNKPLIVEYNGSEVWIQKNWSKGLKFCRLASFVENLNLLSADRVVTVSQALKDELVSKGVDVSRIVFYPNCIDPAVFNPKKFDVAQKKSLRLKLGITDNDFVFTFVGTFGPWHGVDFLVDVINLYFQDAHSNKDTVFLLVGDGVLKKQCEEKLVSQLKGRVVFTGLIEQHITPAYLSISDCFLSPHTRRDGERFFGSPTKIFEYMAMEKPIIASALEQLSEIFGNPSLGDEIDRHNDAILFTPNDHDALLKKIVFVRNSTQELRDSIGINARKLVLNNYTWKKHVEVIINE